MQEETVTQRGIRLAKEGKMGEARIAFQSVLDDTPDDASARVATMGHAYLHEEAYAKALP